MLMMTGYMDETGHSKDKAQRFCGMAGLLAPALNWLHFERHWRKTLHAFAIPYFHMKDFANRRGHIHGWSEEKRRALLKQLMDIMETSFPIPIGSIIPMADFKRFTPTQQSYFCDPYHFAYQNCIIDANTVFSWMERLPSEERIAMVFSDHVEFKHQALRMYEQSLKTSPLTARMYPPDFREMRDLVPLQGADIVAYELYKECERRIHRPDADTRYGYKRIVKMSEWHGLEPLFRFHSRQTLGNYVRDAERTVTAAKA